ncbi:MAG: hypothetical protein R1F54_04730 [Candidatus Zeuxoniibacter abyssi]|nr:MAG: hypothetical protein R1F54_04730 [Candidatus Persebacteraceae bacterium AB1(2)]
MPKKILFIVAGLCAFLAVAGLTVVFDWSAVSLFVSLMAAFLAVFLPHQIAVARWRATSSVPPFSFWGLKFSLTVLFLALSVRLLSETGFLSAPPFIGGVVLALIANIMPDMRTAMREI